MSVLGWTSFITVYLFLPEYTSPSDNDSLSEMSITDIFQYDFIKAVLIIAVVCTLLMAVFVSFVPSLADTLNIDIQ